MRCEDERRHVTRNDYGSILGAGGLPKTGLLLNTVVESEDWSSPLKTLLKKENPTHSPTGFPIAVSLHVTSPTMISTTSRPAANEEPTAHQRQLVRQEMLELDAEVATLEASIAEQTAALARTTALMDAKVDHLRELRSILSPLLSLPNELLGELFESPGVQHRSHPQPAFTLPELFRLDVSVGCAPNAYYPGIDHCEDVSRLLICPALTPLALRPDKVDVEVLLGCQARSKFNLTTLNLSPGVSWNGMTTFLESCVSLPPAIMPFLHTLRLFDNDYNREYMCETSAPLLLDVHDNSNLHLPFIQLVPKRESADNLLDDCSAGILPYATSSTHSLRFKGPSEQAVPTPRQQRSADLMVDLVFRPMPTLCFHCVLQMRSLSPAIFAVRGVRGST
ncbi:hypothetical protein C8R43DRAFT_942775 [Mycena crocata]|nr:hypothetical protein C8R43DRAFT_942775 [Mycena crocata]